MFNQSAVNRKVLDDLLHVFHGAEMGFEIQPCAGQADLLNKIGIDEIMLGGDFAVVPAVVPFKIRSASMTATRKPFSSVRMPLSDP